MFYFIGNVIYKMRMKYGTNAFKAKKKRKSSKNDEDLTGPIGLFILLIIFCILKWKHEIWNFIFK